MDSTNCQEISCDVADEGEICSGSCPDYSYTATRIKGVNHIQIRIPGKLFPFNLETTDKYTISTDVHKFVETAKKLI